MSSKSKSKLAAIMFTDIVGFSKIMGDDEYAGINILENQESIVNPLVNKYTGNIIKRTGDGYLIEFSSSIDAVNCAIEMQNLIKENNSDFLIRIGIHLGDIVVIGDDIIGDGVNIAARIEPLAHPGGICITEAVYQSVKSKLDIKPKRIDEVDLKHIDDKYTIYSFLSAKDTPLDSQKSQDAFSGKIKLQIENIINKFDNIKDTPKLFFLYFLSIYIFIKSIKIASAVILQCLYYIEGFITPFINLEKLPEKITTKLPIFEEIGLSNYTLIFTEDIFKGIIGAAIISAILLYMTIKKKSTITFKDIRSVDNIFNVLLVQMDFHYLGKNKEKIEYYWDGDDDENFRNIKSFIRNNLYLKKINTLHLVFDGNTVSINGQNWQVIRIMKEIKKFVNKNRAIQSNANTIPN